MATILGSLDQDSLVNLEDFLRRGDHDGSLHDEFASRVTAVPHQDGSDALSHASSESVHDVISEMSHTLHSSHILLPQLGPLPVFGSPAPSSTADSQEHASKKRKSMDTNASTIGGDWGNDDDESNADEAFVSARPQVSWTVNNHETWHRIFDPQMNEIEQPGFRAEVDKGFKHSIEGEGWICQKKNHFQVTVALKISAQPAYVATRSGLLKVSGLFINVHGVKLPVVSDAAGGKIPMEQSQSDRSKKAFAPLPVAVLSNEITKVTIGRLHFTETTANNMRKKGKPNPDQRYFALVVTLAARAGDALYTIASHLSEKIIVRASNPGQFETESNVHWVRGESLNSIFHNGPVGINVECPEDALCVRGNIRLSGAVLQPSDVRLKTDITPLDNARQLSNVRNLRLYRYRLNDAWAETCGRTGADANECGILAQEVECVLPEAVRRSNSVAMRDGSVVEDLLVVNKERIFMENIGAVQQLGKIADTLQERIDQLEAVNNNVCTAIRRSSSLQELQSYLGSVSLKPSSESIPEIHEVSPILAASKKLQGEKEAGLKELGKGAGVAFALWLLVLLIAWLVSSSLLPLLDLDQSASAASFAVGSNWTLSAHAGAPLRCPY